jgi:gamma-glutamyltranspeptidase/glutathione hydrolase
MSKRTSFVALLYLLPCFSLVAQSTMFPPVRGMREMIAAANNFEVEAGYRILSAGGNAVDAGVASILAASVTEQSRFGLGGELPLLLKLKGKPVVAISGVGTAPGLATVEAYRTRSPELWERPGRMTPIPVQGIRAALVPGALSGLLVALEQYGTKSFADVVAPAIEYADGFPLPEEFASFLRRDEPILQLWPTSSQFFLPGGKVTQRGEILREPIYAATLRAMVAVERKARGNRAKKIRAVHDYFYRGVIAKEIAAFSEANGGYLRYGDLQKFRAETDTPRSIKYRGYEIYKPGFWSQGPVMLQALAILEGYDLRAMGHNSPEYLHTVVEAVKLAFADRDRHYGDPKFSAIPEQILLSEAYARERRSLIDPAHASMAHRPGSLQTSTTIRSGSDHQLGVVVQDTTCVNVVDRNGNFFSATPSGAWLPSVIAGKTGIPLSSRMQAFVLEPGHPNQLAPGKRPRVTLSPTMVLKDGQPVMAMSTPGGDNQDQAMLQVLLNIIEFGMPPQEAVEAPRFQSEHFYASFANHEFVPGKLNVENRLQPDTVERLKALGHTVQVSGPWSNSSAPTVIWLSNGVLHGGADPRRGRFIFGR